MLGAGEAGLIAPSGAIDVFAMEDQLDEDATIRLREIALEGERSGEDFDPEREVAALVTRFEMRRIDALQKELTRKMSDPAADKDALLRQKDEIIRRKAKVKQGDLGLLERETHIANGGDSSKGGMGAAPHLSP